MQKRLLMTGVAVLFFAATTLAGPKLHCSYTSAPTAEALDNYNEVQYHYRYAVDDPTSGVINDRWEHRHGEYVKGAYSVLEPDGRLRIVDYEVDGPKGFHAVVRTQFPGNSLLSYVQLQKSLKQHRDPLVNVLTNQRVPTDSSEFNNQRAARLLHKDLPVNFHSISPNYYLSPVPGQRTNYPSATKEAFRTTSPDHENAYEYHSSPTPSINVETLAATRRDSGQPSQFILPPPAPASHAAYNQFTEGTPLGLSSTQFTRTYYGG